MRKRGFTLIELLVVIGIMVVLMAILLPMLSKARAAAQRTAIASDLVGIAQALDQYKNDWGDYPRTTISKPINVTGTSANPSTGAILLCWALIAPGPALTTGSSSQIFDGADGPGFRVRAILQNGQVQGKVYGPYLNVDHYRYGTLVGDGTPALNLTPNGQPADNSQTMIADRNGNAILYFPGNSSVSVSTNVGGAALMVQQMIGAPLAGAAQPFVYNYGDNIPPLPGSTMSPGSSLTPKILTLQLGGSGGSPLIAPYFLLSAGHDGRFGPPTENGATIGDSDDVAYPDQLNSIPLGTMP
ncbi:MAG TPA: type II secretion system protein [Tepidisphaeraceae bacterium]